MPIVVLSSQPSTLTLSGTAESTSTNTGALQVAGGVGIAKNLITTGKIGIGTTNPNGLLTLYSTTQSNARIVLSGQEFYVANTTSTDGVALLCGVNRTANKQLWIADSALLTQNTTNPTIRLGVLNNTASIAAVATDGLTSLPMTISASTLDLPATVTGTNIQLRHAYRANKTIANLGSGQVILFDVGSGGLNLSNGMYLVSAWHTAGYYALSWLVCYGGQIANCSVITTTNATYFQIFAQNTYYVYASAASLSSVQVFGTISGIGPI